MKKYNKGFGIVRILLVVIVVVVIGFIAYNVGKNSNPMYTDNGNQGTNPLYTSDNNIIENTMPIDTGADCTSNSPSIITVLSPNGGEVYKAGQQITVKWKSCNVSNYIGIILNVSTAPNWYQGNPIVLADGGYEGPTVNDGIETFTIPSSISPGQYKIWIRHEYDGFTGYAYEDKSDNYFTINAPVSSNQNTITKNDWGVSFTKGSTWNITTNTNDKVVLTQQASDSAGDTISITYSSGQSITDSDAKFGNITYFYDSGKQVWMETDNMEGEGLSPNPYPVPAKIIETVNGYKVFGGTGRWLTYIVPLSTNTFLKLNISGGGYLQPLKDLLQTVHKI